MERFRLNNANDGRSKSETGFRWNKGMMTSLLLFNKNGPTQASVFVYFRPPPNKQYNFYNKSLWKNVHPVKRRRDSNTRPFEHESSPITTRPELPPNFISSCFTFSSSTRTSTCPSWRSWPPSGCPFLWWSDSTSGSGTRRSRDRGNLFTFKLARRRAANDRIRGKFSSRHLAFWA